MENFRNKLIIKNVGPIKDITLYVNKVNVFMGPQCSGKSTIAKIISYCTWVEKDVATSQSLEKYKKDKYYFRNLLESFHKMRGYINKDSIIEFESNIIKLKYTEEKFTIEWKNRYDYKRNKISYIPAERNIAALTGVEKLELPHNNIRSFLFDWYDARKTYPNDRNLSILNLGLQYYSEENGEDHVRFINNGDSYDILLSNASSGLQSITPIVLLIDYLTSTVYSQNENESYNDTEKKRKILEELLIEIIVKPSGLSTFTNFSEMNPVFTEIDEAIRRKDPEMLKRLNEYNRVVYGLFKTHNTHLIIEEPEQNLFPETQRDLVYYLLEKCNNTRQDCMTLTTHSPYILYALNNCIMAGLVYDKMDEKDKQKLTCRKSIISPQKISIYEIEEGALKNIQDKEGSIGENYFDEQMKKLMDDYYLMLNYYE
ncbi:MAG: ATP-binding protein [Flavobacteriaceae bacterium]|jgi:predicted ATP-dependent endonuclease of OLD family|nr:ATP-binding protein [Flavobacteriaceae bacterium]